ncbi:MAG: 30S ribosome-binding factor RbfA [Chromatiales bacterium]|nr:30S ribosome-binding factor RbfA [Chromatiales bacterium]
MPREFKRTDRVGAQMAREIAQIIRNDLRDPRVRDVTIQSVDVSRDFAHARIWITSLLPDGDLKIEVDALNHGAAFVRRELMRRMRLRHVPELHFSYDASVERAEQLDALIDAARARDIDGAGHDPEPGTS